MAQVIEFSPPKRLRDNVDDEIEILTLAPFKPVPKITFQNIKVNGKARKRLIIKNPSNGSLTAQLVALPPEDRCLEFSFTAVDLSPGEEAVLEIVWSPTEAGNWRESIPVRTSSKFKSEIVIICSSINPQATKNIKKPLSSRNNTKPTYVAKKLVVPKPFRPQVQKQSGVSSTLLHQQVKIARSLPRKGASSPDRRQTFLVSAENKENSPHHSKKIKPGDKPKHDISKRFEDFVLSPLNTNLTMKHPRCNALDDLVMSPVVLRGETLPGQGADFVDGDASDQPKAVFQAEFDNVSPVSLRRATFAVPNTGKTVYPLCPADSLRKPLVPEIHVISANNQSDEFSDSLEEADHKIATSSSHTIASSPVKFVPVEFHFKEPKCIQKEVVLPEVPDSFMNSTIQFDIPLPSEDPRRCSTGIKVVQDSESLSLGSNVRKDLFDFLVSPPRHPQNTDPSVLAHEFNEYHALDAFSGEIGECLETHSSDRLSCSTYVKDRLSTGTYVKDRLSTGTYVKDQHSRGSMNDDSGDGSVFLHDESVQADKNSLGSFHSPKFDDHLFAHGKSPLLSIEEEDVGCQSEVAIRNEKLRSTAFTVSLSNTEIDSKTEDRKPQVKHIKPLKTTVQRKPSPKKRRMVIVSPTLKKSVSTLAIAKSAAPASSKAIDATMRRKSFLIPSQGSNKSIRRASIGNVNITKTPLSAKLPEANLSLSKIGLNFKVPDQSIFKIPRGSKRIAQMQSDKSEILFNPDEILAEVTNVDPFAASTTEDPFLSCSIYNDTAWMARQERDMIKWLNALLTPPAELEANTDLPAIDVGDLWQKTCRLKEVNFAPSREEVSSDHYDKQNRLHSLRKAALNLLRSRDVATVLQKVSVHVDKKLLSVRADRDLHLDVGLQQLVLELLLCYNPLWLRIGLEAVYGRTVPLKSNSDYIGLVAFIVHNLLSDAHIVATYSHPTVPHLKLPGFQDEMKKFTLKKFLFIVFFLDCAKNRKLISHDPCLFMRSAKFKESREIAVAFARELLAGIGDVNRHLTAIGCKLTVKQTFLDEFQYGVQELLDLRDGVRLVRVMELILNTTGLLGKVRVPAISKLQKVHNVEVAMTALREAGYVICGDIQAKHVAEGHREKTLSLLWQLIYKFQAPRFIEAAEAIQRWWRRCGLGREIERRIRARKRARRENAATTIQSLWRGVQARRLAAQVRAEQARLREARHQAAVVLQKHWRRHAAEQQLHRARLAATSIARWYRGAVLTQRLRAVFLRQRAAAVTLQAHCRGLMTRKRFAELRQTAAALRIQTWYRRQRTARLLLAAVEGERLLVAEQRRRLAASRRLQAAVRAWLARRRDRGYYLALHRAAVTLQRRYRARLAMRAQQQKYLTLRRAAVAVQQRFRAQRAMRIQRGKFCTLRAAAITIQKQVRMHLARKRFLALRQAALVVQARWRGRVIAKILRVDFLFKRRAARYLQTSVRAWLAGRRERSRYLQLRAATVHVQRSFRARLACKSQRFSAALIIQRRWRAQLAMRRQRAHFVALREAACGLQRWYRAQLAMREDRAKYERLRSAAVSIQRMFRAHREMRRERERYHSVREAVVVVQRRWRAQVALKKQRARFLEIQNAARVLQCRYRAKLEMRRGQSDFQRVRSAAVIIQRRFRSYRDMLQQRDRYLELRKGAAILQRRWRAQLAMRTQRDNFVEVREATCVIQRRYRALLLMRDQQAEYQRLRSAAVTVQTHLRAHFKMQEQRDRYLSLRRAAITIQQRWRAKRAALRERDHWLLVRKATIVIQRRWRATKSARQERLHFQRTCHAVETVQKRWRATLYARKERKAFEQLRSSAKIIQVRWRLRKAALQEKEHFQVLRTAVISIQKYARGYLGRMHYLQLKNEAFRLQTHQNHAARYIQLYWRKWHSERKQNECRHQAAIKIQASWRGYQSRKRYEEETQRLRELVDKHTSGALEPQTMKERISILCYDIEGEKVGGVTVVLNSLHTISGLSPTLCEEMISNNIVSKLFTQLCSVNRSVAEATCAKIATKILVNLCKYNKIIVDVWKDGTYLNLYPHLMKKWLAVEESILLHFLTILWHFSQNPQWAQVIVADEKLVSTIKFCISKYRSRKSKTGSNPTLPAIGPNWGSLKKKMRPSSFEDHFYGLRALCYKLNLDINV